RGVEDLLRAGGVSLLLLDVKLPGEDGFSIARNVRRFSQVPIIMLTGQGHEVDRVLGLELGADDYLVKPFSPRELLARIRAVLRRYPAAAAAAAPLPAATPMAAAPRPPGKSFRFAGWQLATGARKLTSPAGARVELTNGEFALLLAFLHAPRRVLSRDQLLEHSRLHDDVFDRSIDVQILRLRRKIEPDANVPTLIRTERGAGYFLDCDVSAGAHEA
ncbi:MAG: winged helix-turn-helix domain-containing protein, partial [Betaproteobacteria bacterium]|nr:winged helix-turn-helix domain-containing protein [Betaproteobacteria bacterium]